MYFDNISNEELQYFHGLKVPNFTIKLTDILHQTSNVFDNKLFKIEEIITGSIYRIYPMFYTGKITSSNPSDKIFDNKLLICKKETKETFITFISDENEPVQDYVDYGTYYNIGDSLTTAQFNSIVDLLRNNTVHQDSFRIKQGMVNGEWGDYTFDIESTTIVDNGILVTDETLTNLGTVMLTAPKFHYTTYTLKLKVYHMTDINIGDTSADNIVVDTLSIVLEEDVAKTIPFNTLDYSYVIGLDATVEIKHDVPVIPDIIKRLKVSANPSIIQSGDTTDITATGLDIGGVNVGAGHTVYFFEKLEPSITMSASSDIIQTSDNLELYATVKDEDGSLAKGVKVYFFKED